MRTRNIITATFIVILTVLNPTDVSAGLILTQGQTVDLEFSSISPTIPLIIGNPYYYAEFQLGANGLDDGESVKFTAYANDINGPVMDSVVWSYMGASLPGQLPTIWGGLHANDIESTPWPNLRGAFQLEVISGTIELESFTANTIINGNYYGQTYAIPESRSITMIITGVGLLYFRKKLPTSAWSLR